MTNNEIILQQLKDARCHLKEEQYVCYAITKGQGLPYSNNTLAGEMIQQRLQGSFTVIGWLKRYHGINEADILAAKGAVGIRDYRRRWLESMIREYQNKVNAERLLKVFKAANGYLHARHFTFVCNAINHASIMGHISGADATFAKEFISERIGYRHTVMQWLDHRTGFQYRSEADQLDYRQRWLDSLITEMTEKSK